MAERGELIVAGGGLASVADGVWCTTAPVSILGMKLTSTMTVLRIGERLVLHSPVRMTPALRASVESLGTVAHLYAPNTYHHMWIGEWAAAFPKARVHGPAALAKKRPDLRIDRAHDVASEPEFEGVIDEVHVDGFMLEETVLAYRPAKTLLVADLVHNIGRPPELWTIFYAGLMGFYDRVAISRVIRWAAFTDRKAARRSLDLVLDRPFERMVVGHGTPVAVGAHDALAAAYGWLPPRER